MATRETALTIRWTPPDGAAFVVDELPRVRLAASGEVLHQVLDDVAEAYLDLLDDLSEEVEELEEVIDEAPPEDVRRRLGDLRTVIASLLFFPTFVAGVYGQNFEDLPELGWRLGYAWSWGVILVVTVVQLALFRWRRWI